MLLLAVAGCGGGSSADGASPAVIATAPFKPFPQHVGYTAGTIKPDHVSQARLDAASAAFYDEWKKKYLLDDCGADRIYVRVGDAAGGGTADETISVSEGHGYGMMITALMAGHDPDARKYFDGLFRFFKDHPSASSPNLMAWNQVKGCANSSRPGADGTATDGDLDIAHALILADRQWGSDGAINYLQEARSVVAAIKKFEINPTTFGVLLGDWAAPSQPQYHYGTRTSDFVADHFRAYQALTQDGDWARVIDQLYAVVRTIQANDSPNTGLMPDFVVATDASARPAPADYLEGAQDGEYGYNACRVPWRLGTDYLLHGDARALAALRKINAWIQVKAGGDAGAVIDGYTLAGADSAGAFGFSMAFVAPLAVSAMSDGGNQAWLNSLWSKMADAPLAGTGYYENTLKLLSMIVVSGNWWKP